MTVRASNEGIKLSITNASGEPPVIYIFFPNLSGCLPCRRDVEQNLQEHR